MIKIHHLSRAITLSIASLALALPVLGFKGAEDIYAFTTLPKVGDVADFKEHVTLTINGQDIVIETTLHQLIDAVTANGATQLTETESGTTVSVGGQQTPAPEAKPIALSFLPDGTLKDAKFDGADGNWYRLFNLSIFLHPDAPVKKGETWTKTVPGNKTTGAAPFKAVYTVVGPEQVAAWKTVKIHYQILETDVESPATGEGDMWIGLNDSQLVKLSNKFKGAPAPGGGGTVLDGLSTLERIK